MPTTKPRITITLTERQHAVLRSLSKSSGQSMTAYIVEFMELAMPTLERMAVAMQAISQASQTSIQRVCDQLEQAQAVLEPIAAQALEQADLFWGRIESAARPGTAEEATTPPARASQHPSTPITNRGVTPRCSKPANPSPSAVSGVVRARSRRKKTES